MKSMPSSPWLAVWPGLPDLWLRARWEGLGFAIIFAIIVNMVLASTFLWPGMIGNAQTTLVFNVIGWFIVLCFWGVSLVSNWHRLRNLQTHADSRGDDTLFTRAQTEYLKGNWFAAEKQLLQLLEKSPRDADAQLLLATVERRLGRSGEAEKRLRHLETLTGGGKWLFEIDEQRRLLAQNGSETDDDERPKLVAGANPLAA